MRLPSCSSNSFCASIPRRLWGSAQYWIGDSLYAQKQFEAAIVAFDEVIRKYPEDNKVPAALLKQGYAFAELKDVRNARFFATGATEIS